ncbi:UNVERIFIED_ORG: AAA family ATPase [Clostridium botulinum]|uniref:AAA family ATPase n=1 Tax=Clostridium botulinum TaxID=1491 RepID=UPI000597AE3F|nr:AAA family ATPase [Clostridium botulinum]KIL08210.1 ATPase AAA [Clostridium botulinum]MBY6935550.1 AAA family ATPase [Clostridium botulinum]NFL83629.1 AAA family ATPase [Clostridium botulinum]NFN12792.1 AAA family ATPase [Clostridium botulinum]NFO37834.1 AAA family ATPase [Clostridium botulinum]
MKKNIQVGTSDFREIIKENYYFVDKSLLIKEFLENSAKVILTPRPRRFGKTLNMSMLKYFFDIENKDENKDLFKGLEIGNEEEIMKMQGAYPVIFLTFKNEKHLSFENLQDGIKSVMYNIYMDHYYLLESEKLSQFDKERFKEILDRKGSIVEFSEALSNLMRYLNKHYNKKVIVLIDEYDVPIQESYLRGYYEEAIVLIRNILTAALKDNVYLEKSLVTGILRVAKESIFSGLNNIEVDSILGINFNDKFGFTEEQVINLLEYYNLSEKIDEVKKWYNGYIFGGKIIYNPWSVLNYIKNNAMGFMPYWINSSSNDLIKRLLSNGNEDTKKNLEELIKGNSIKKIVDDHVVMKDVEDDEENLWGFLTLSGYLKSVNKELIRGKFNCELKIPNEEVSIFYENLIEKWFKESLTSKKYAIMLNALVTGDVETFGGFFKNFVLNNISYFDVSGEEPEKVYHAFVLGMIVSLSDKYEVKSNKESGYGRYDVMLIPKDTSKLGIIMEFKKIDDFMSKSIEKGIEEALNQIEENKYEAELKERNISNILKLAIVFKGKKIEVVEGTSEM